MKKNEDFLYEIRPPLREEFVEDLNRRLAKVDAQDAPDSLSPNLPPWSLWRDRIDSFKFNPITSWITSLSFLVLLGVLVWVAWLAFPREIQLTEPVAGSAVSNATQITPTATRMPATAPALNIHSKPSIQITTYAGSSFSQVRISGLGRQIHKVLSVSPSGEQLLVYAANLSASGTGAQVVESQNDLLYITDLEGESVTALSDRFKNYGITPYVMAYWLPSSNQIVFIDQDEQGAGIFIVNPDGSGRTRLTDPGLSPLWLLPSDQDEVVFWQQGAWQTDPALVLSQGKVAEIGAYYKTLLQTPHLTESVWENFEGYDLVLDAKAEHFAAYTRNECQYAERQMDLSCRTLNIYRADGSKVAQFYFAGQPHSFTWLPSGQRLVVGVLKQKQDERTQEIHLIDVEEQTDRKIDLVISGPDYWLPVVLSLYPQNEQLLVYHTDWDAPQIMSLTTLTTIAAEGLAPPQACRTAGRCPDLLYIPKNP